MLLEARLARRMRDAVPAALSTSADVRRVGTAVLTGTALVLAMALLSGARLATTVAVTATITTASLGDVAPLGLRRSATPTPFLTPS